MTDDHAGHDHAALDLDRFLPYRLSVLSNRISQAIAKLYQARFGFGITEWRVIAVLGRYPALSANTVAERTAMDKVAVSRAVAHLLERGLLTREMHGDASCLRPWIRRNASNSNASSTSSRMKACRRCWSDRYHRPSTFNSSPV